MEEETGPISDNKGDIELMMKDTVKKL